MAERPPRIRWLAVAAGYFADFTLSLIVVGVATLFGADFTRGATFNTPADAIGAGLLVLSTGAGGWLAGRLAKHEHVLHGALVGGIGIFDMLFMSFFGDRPPLANILLQIVAVCIGGVGGWLSRWIPAPQGP